jgi:hypothetical protein
VKAKTSSRNVVLRYLLTIISFLLKNIWVALQWMFFSKVQRGPRTIDEDLFRFDFFRLFVLEGSGKNSNLFRLFLFFDLSVDLRLVRVDDYPKFMEENFEKYCAHKIE